MTTSTIIRDIRCAVEASRGDPGFFPTSEMVLRLAAELESVAAERDRLQRACDEGLPRERLTCPHCGTLHVDGADGTEYGWRPHHTHLCQPDNGGCGRTFDTGRWSYGADVPADAAAQELDAAETLIVRLGGILSGVALALKGTPPPLTTYSTHDLAEVASSVVAERDRAHAEGRAAGLREAQGIVETFLHPSTSPEPSELDYIVSAIGYALREAEVDRG